MAILRKVQLIFLFDMERCQWWQFREDDWQKIDPDDVPKAKGKYTGIGSRQLSPEGKAPIEMLYQKNNIADVEEKKEEKKGEEKGEEKIKKKKSRNKRI